MSSIIISGRPNSELTSNCILLSEELKKSYPSLLFIVILKHSEEWVRYSEEVCKLYGFQNSTHPLIFFSNGQLIGDKEAFFEYVNLNFSIDYCPSKSVIYNLTQENILNVNKEYSTRIEGMSLIDNIYSKCKEVEFDNIYNALDYDYTIEYLLSFGIMVYVKYDIKFIPLKDSYEVYLNPLDDNEVQVDMTNMRLYEKKVSEKDNLHSSVINPNSSMIQMVVKDKEQEENENENEEKEKEEEDIEIKLFNYKTYKRYSAFYEKVPNEHIVANNIGFGYSLILLPSNTYYGEMVLINKEKISKNKGEDLVNNNNHIQIEDSGRLPSLRKIQYEDIVNRLLLLDNLQLNTKISPTNEFILNMNTTKEYCVLSDYDIFYIMKTIKETNSIVTLRILPYGYNDYKRLNTNKIKVIPLPLKEIQSALPLGLYLKEKKMNKREENLKSDLKIDYFPFRHYFSSLSSEKFTFSYIKNMILTAFQQLQISNSNGKGLIFLMTNEFLFMTQLTRPYFLYNNEFGLFPEPLFYTGVYNLPIIDAEWDETVNRSNVKFDLLGILNKSSSD